MIAAVVTDFTGPVLPVGVPAPLFAASGITPEGLPYPTIDDHPAQIPTYIGELADATADRIANPGLVVGVGTLGFDANGAAWMNFPQISALGGVVVHPLSTAGDTRTIVLCVAALAGPQAQILAGQVQQRTDGYATLAYQGALTVMALAWGAPA